MMDATNINKLSIWKKSWSISGHLGLHVVLELKVVDVFFGCDKNIVRVVKLGVVFVGSLHV